jgi:hypothetical protein
MQRAVVPRNKEKKKQNLRAMHEEGMIPDPSHQTSIH